MKKLIVASGLSLAMLIACETQQIDLCEGVTCSGHGACLVDSSSAVCLCEAGYEPSGTECLPADPCSPNPCIEPHRSTCTANGATAVCSCDPGYWDRGECVPAASCEPNPCTAPNQSVCTSNGTSIACACDPGYVEVAGGCVPYDPCDPNPCAEPNRTVCHASGQTAVCSCDEGYWDVGECVPAVSCEPNPCTELHRSVCALSGSGIVCGCDQGYVDDGNGGCVPADPCDPNPCTAAHRTSCRAAGITAVCSCDDGYREDAQGSCIEACNPNPCTAPHQSVCLPVPGGYQCGCDTGYASINGNCVFVQPPDCARAHLDGDDFEPDECPSLATPLAVPSSVRHSISDPGDEDWFAFDAVDGLTYVFEIDANYRLEISVRDSTGTTVLGSASDDYYGNPPLAVRTGPGRFLVRVKGLTMNSNPGFYSLRVSAFADDFGNSALLASALSIATPVSGAFEYAVDEDWFAIPATAGRPLKVTVTGTAGFKAEVFDSIAAASPADSSSFAFAFYSGHPLVFAWKPRASLSHYLRLSASSSTLATYSILVEELSDVGDDPPSAASLSSGTQFDSALDFSLDVDWFVFSPPSSSVYQISITGDGSISADLFSSCALSASGCSPISSRNGWDLRAKLMAGQSYYLRVRCTSLSCGSYSVNAVELAPDDFGDSADVATELSVGQTATGQIQFAGDQDWFFLDVVQGRVYEATYTGDEINLALYGPDGTTQLDPGGFSHGTASFRFCSWDDERRFLRVTEWHRPSAFSLVVREVGSDSAANAASGAATISLDTLVPGALEYRQDVDWFSLPLEAAHIYRFELVPSNLSARLKLFSTDTSTQIASAASSTSASFVRQMDNAGTHFLSVSAESTGSGAYALFVADLGLDDHGNSSAAATPLAVGGSQAGSLQFSGDVDWLSIPTAEGHGYRVTVTPLGFTAQARLIGSDGHTELATQTSFSPMNFQLSAATAAPYFVALSAGYANGVGSFRVEVEDLGLTQ